jgi:hypothetical protein
MAAGARRTLRSATAHLQHVPVTGVDGLAGHGPRAVDEGPLAATVSVPSNTGPALALLIRMLRDGISVADDDRTLLPQSYPDIGALTPRA